MSQRHDNFLFVYDAQSVVPNIVPGLDEGGWVGEGVLLHHVVHQS